MHPSENELVKATQCPDCEGNKVEKILDVSGLLVLVRGHDWNEFKQENKEAMRRDMAIHQLEHNDPYGYMRTREEKDELADQLKASVTQKPKPQYFTGTSKRS